MINRKPTATPAGASSTTYADWVFKRRHDLIWLPLLMEFLFLTLPFIIHYQQFTDANPILRVGPQSLFLLRLLFVWVVVHHYFSFLHTKGRSELVFALPQSRSHIFFSLLGKVFFTLGLWSLGSLAQDLLVHLVFGRTNWSKVIQIQAYVWLLLAASGVFLIYFYCRLSNSFNAQFAALLLVVMGPLAYLLLHYYAFAMLPNSAWYQGNSFVPFLLSPYIAILFNPLDVWPGMVYWVSFSVVFGLASYLAFVKRPVELVDAKPGEHTSPMLGFIKGLTALTGGLLLALILHLIRYSFNQESGVDYFLMAFGLVVGLLLTSLLADLILRRGEIRLGQGLLWGVRPLVVLALIVALLMSGLLGWGKTAPEPGETLYVDLSTAPVRSYRSITFGVTSFTGDFTGNDSDRSAYLRFTSPQQIAAWKELVERVQVDTNPGLSLPRHLASRDWSERFLADHYQKFLWTDLYLTWPGSTWGQEERLIGLYAETAEAKDDPAIHSLLTDPGFHLFYQRTSPGSFFRYVNISVQDETRLSDAWQDLLYRLRRYPDLLDQLGGQVQLMEVLQLDYNALSEEDRRALVKDAPMRMEMNRYSSPLPAEAEDNEPDLSVEKLSFPLSADFRHLQAYLEERLNEYEYRREYS